MTDANFTAVIPLLLELEGGLSVDPHDPGGTTNYGISQRSYPHLDIPNLTVQDAENIYFTDFWTKYQCGAIPVPLGAYYFDACVNQGSTTAIRILQQTVGVTQDGIIGPATLGACAGFPRAKHYLFLIHRFNVYRNLSGWPYYGVGWTNRLLHLASSLGA